MATWKTGRSRTLSISGTMTGDFAFCIDTEPIGQPTVTHTKQSSGSLEVAWGISGAIVTWQQAPTIPTVGGDHFYGTLVTASDGQGHSGSNQAGEYIHQTHTSGVNIDWELSATGSWSFSCDVEEWASSYTPSSSSIISGSPFPNFGGASEADGLPASGIQFFELARVGGALSAHVDFGGASVTLSNPIVSAFPIGYVQVGTVYSGVFGASNVYSGESSIELDAGVTLPSQVWTDSDSNGSSTATYSGRNLVMLTVNVPGASAGGYGSASAAIQATTNFRLDGRLRCFDHDFPNPGKTLRIQVNPALTSDLLLNPSGIATWSQGFFNIAATLQGVDYGPSSIDERGPVSSWLIDLTPDDSRDWRCMFRGLAWDAISVARSPTLSVDPCTSLSHWSEGPHTTLSLVGAGLGATASGGTGSITLAVPAGLRVWEVYRYLQVSGSFDPGTSLSPPDSITLSASLAGQSWNFNLNRSPQSPRLDLCCASTETEPTEAIQTRFPIADPGGFPIATDPQVPYKLGWGVQFCDSITFSGIPDGYSITLTGIDLVSSSDSLRQASLTLLEPFLSFQPGWTSASDNTSLQAYCLVESDDRVCDLPALAHVVPFSGPESYVWFSIAQLQSMLTYFPGLTANLLPDPADGYHTAGLPALLAGGEGTTYDWSTNLWTDWIDQPLALTIPSQDLWDEVSVYPGAGVVWTTSGLYGPTIPLQVSKSLRGQAWGLVFDQLGRPLVGAPIRAYQTATPTAPEGTATANRLGFYLTEDPWELGNIGTTIELDNGPIPHLTVLGTSQNRRRIRGSFRFVFVGLAKGYDVSQSLRHVRSVVSRPHIILGAASNPLPQSWTDRDTGLEGRWARPRFVDHGSFWPVGLFYGDGTECFFALTYDEGSSWGTVIDMSTGSIGDYEEGANGLRWFFKLQSSDGGVTWDVWGKLLDSQLNVVRDWTITNLTNVDNEPIAVRESPGDQGSWRIGLLYSTGGSPAVKFSFDGLAFA